MRNSTIDKLISTISKLPGLGPKSARRIVLHLIKNPQNNILPLSDQLLQAAEEVKTCELCGNIDTVSPCLICTDEKRDDSILCLVETVSELWALERSNFYKGKYHILGGNLSALNGKSPDTLNFELLTKKVSQGAIKEVIIATNATLEGQTTGHYIVDLLTPFNIKITRLAYGIPMGAELDYMDEGTLNLAIKMRQDF